MKLNIPIEIPSASTAAAIPNCAAHVVNAPFVASQIRTLEGKPRIMRPMGRMLTAMMMMAVGLTFSGAAYAKPVKVTSDADFGPGSLREAIADANGDLSIGLILIKKNVVEIEIASALEYTGVQDLSINGNGATILATDLFAGDGLLISSGGANLSLSHLTVDCDFADGETAANGVFIPVPAGQGGELSVSLNDVTLENCGRFGLHVSDQIDNSDASLRLSVVNSLVVNNGIGELDFDGIRVDEGGDGDIIARIVNSSIDGNGGDGLELDEKDDGIVDLDVVGSTFDDNGFFDIANPGKPDLDDGLDIDEAGDGGIVATFTNSSFSGNFDEGLDLDEEDAGDIDVAISNVNANMNDDEGIKITEEDGGGLFALFRNVNTIGSLSQDGIQLEEEDEGDLDVTVLSLTSTDNKKFGLKVEQDTEGGDTGTLKLRGSTLEPNGKGGLDLDGVDLE